VDLGGQSGIEADVDRHWGEALAGATLSGVLSASASAIAGPTNQLAIDPRQQAIYGSVQPLQELGEAQAKTFLKMEPTLSLEPGSLAGLLVTSSLSFGP
jgi:type IV secretory pathway VirB10-like protein